VWRLPFLRPLSILPRVPNSRIAIYAGSFDPITRGHEDLMHRSLEYVDRLIVAVATNSSKAPLFSIDERVDLIRSARGYWERAGALWAATIYVIHRQTQADPRRLIVAHEWLCRDPLRRFPVLYRRLGLDWGPETERFIRDSDREGDDRTYSVVRPIAKQIDKWKTRLRPEDIDACRAFVEPFALPYYPAFEPFAKSFSGEEPPAVARASR
jgi:cytidyltransferase-like protein